MKPSQKGPRQAQTVKEFEPRKWLGNVQCVGWDMYLFAKPIAPLEAFETATFMDVGKALDRG